MKKIYTIFIFFLITNFLSAQTITGGFTWDNVERSYRLFIPSDYTPGESLPLVLNFHGFTSFAEQQEGYSAMNLVADTAKFFVVYPEGVDNAWNVGWAFGSNEDDVGFTNALIDSLHAEYGINLDRVYSCGMSNGGFFSYKLACELNDRIAKIASVTGSMVASEANNCIPANPIPVMQIHGTADNVVNYNGSPGVSIPIEELLENWIELNGCTPVSDTIFVEDISTTDFSTAQLIQYRDCDDNVMIAFYKIIGGQHTWPGAPIAVGITNYDINASVEIWNFFNDQYPLDMTVSSNEPVISKQKITVFPNPFQDNFTLNSSVENIKSIRVLNALGRTIYSNNNLNSKAFQINNIDWPKGMYFVQTKTEYTTRTIRILSK